jgi:hypothetical protein
MNIFSNRNAVQNRIIIRVTRKQIEAANKAREAALKKDEAAYGGVLSSDKRAQINLIPKLERLPVEGKTGDLIAIKVGRRRPTFRNFYGS